MNAMTAISVLVALALAGCASDRRCCDPCARVVAVPMAAPPSPIATVAGASPQAPQFAVYDGATGAATSIEAFLDASKEADVVAFGELHGHPVGAAMELTTLEGMAVGPRPVALALEFFERDVQGAIDEYFAGTITEAAFLVRARQGPAYKKTHRPLVEFARTHRIAVLAANAPRRLVTEYRKGEKSYADYLLGLSAADRALLPAETSVATGPYLDRFNGMMGAERGAKLIKAQSLWDDAMADVVAAHRTAHPDVRVLLVVGGFHVAARLGTITKYTARRPTDRVALLVMSESATSALAFDPDDRGEGDVILAVAPISAPDLKPAARSAPAKNP